MKILSFAGILYNSAFDLVRMRYLEDTRDIVVLIKRSIVSKLVLHCTERERKPVKCHYGVVVSLGADDSSPVVLAV